MQKVRGQALEYLARIEQHGPPVIEQILDEVHTRSVKTIRGPSQALGAVVALAAMMATAGTATPVAAFIGVGESLTGTAMVSAAISTLSAQTAVGLMTHHGNVGRVMKDVTSKESLKSLAKEITAAALVGHGGGSGQSLGLLEQFQLHGMRSFVHAGLDVAICGKDAKASLRHALKNTATSALGAYVAGKIGQAYKGENPSLDYLGHKLCHAVLGGATGALLGDDPLKGAVAGSMGAMMAEVLMEAMMPDPQATVIEMTNKAHQEGRLFNPAEFEDLLKTQTHIARLTVAISAFATGQDVNVAATTATNAVENNFWPMVIAIAIPTAKILTEIYILTHEEEIEATKQEVCAYVAEKLGYSPQFVEFVFDGAMMAGSMVRTAKQGYKMLGKKVFKASAVEGAKALNGPKEPVQTPKLERERPVSNLKEIPQSPVSIQKNHWNKQTTFTHREQSNKVYQRDDLINLNQKDGLGRTNADRMKIGRAPLGHDGHPLELHHMLQTQDGSLAEMTREFHRQNAQVIHINPSSMGSGIDRDKFDLWREAYWRNRLKGLKESK